MCQALFQALGTLNDMGKSLPSWNLCSGGMPFSVSLEMGLQAHADQVPAPTH